ncbi:uncharacterized protein LOC143248133 [Tachypleus tridentatus]|uniref:uncharacterized protein LOC143248133 n=1 Tax=Tachypleus tridentatus TaxID=6853 RepID=UPI003FD5D9F6
MTTKHYKTFEPPPDGIKTNIQWHVLRITWSSSGRGSPVTLQIYTAENRGVWKGEHRNCFCFVFFFFFVFLPDLHGINTASENSLGITCLLHSLRGLTNSTNIKVLAIVYMLAAVAYADVLVYYAHGPVLVAHGPYGA